MSSPHQSRARQAAISHVERQTRAMESQAQMMESIAQSLFFLSMEAKDAYMERNAPPDQPVTDEEE